jgi:hypothetical protein
MFSVHGALMRGTYVNMLIMIISVFQSNVA